VSRSDTGKPASSPASNTKIRPSDLHHSKSLCLPAIKYQKSNIVNLVLRSSTSEVGSSISPPSTFDFKIYQTHRSPSSLHLPSFVSSRLRVRPTSTKMLSPVSVKNLLARASLSAEMRNPVTNSNPIHLRCKMTPAQANRFIRFIIAITHRFHHMTRRVTAGCAGLRHQSFASPL